ncbi:MAG: hypothetical protein KAH23_07345, partial [Kiritimatiellae bacterium]|nr:hypothetical protein [Kiritimatiellia bacterium]
IHLRNIIAKYLDQAYEGFVNSLLRMEKANGSKGHIIKDGKQSAQFVSYMIEPIARLHHLTQKAEVVRFLKRVLDWHCEHGTVGGVMRGQKYAPLMFGNIWREAEGRETFVTVIYNFQFADGYAYLYKIYHRKKDLQFSRKIFRDGMFYYGCQAIEKDPAYRTPLGYHFRGRLRNMCSKVHAFSTRYDQIYLQMEQSLAEK